MVPLVEATVDANKILVLSQLINGAPLRSVVIPLHRVHHFARLRQKLEHVVWFGLDSPDRRLVGIIEVEVEFLINLLANFLEHS